ncbi:MAG TPA: hypothetical protein VHN79_08825, partial [Lacunisphaera sp.]|nr:hypothetical protein [Lacunisphaera sp.]
PPSLRDAPVFIHRDAGRYDGAYYAQIATSPALRDPALVEAVDDLGYRARRILLSGVAWMLAGGEAVAAVHVYAWLNPLLWLLLVWQAWRLFPVGDARTLCAWVGIVLASGTLASVRLALTDLAALVLLTATLVQAERGKPAPAAALLGLAGLARETALLGAAALCPQRGDGLRPWLRWAFWMAVAAGPLACWLVYLWRATGSSGTGSSNFAVPLAGWLGRAGELWRSTGVEANRALLTGAWLDYLAVTAQMLYVFTHAQRKDAWWKLGFVYALLGLCLGHAVWEGLPGAASRLLLPLTLAFNVIASRRRAAWVWLILGNLSVVSGVWALLGPPGAPHTLTSRDAGESSYVLETDARWSVAEWNRKWRWSWSEGEGGVSFRIWPHRPHVRVELQVRGITPRELEVRHAGVTVWQGRIGDRPRWITLPELPMIRGRLDLELRSETPATQEGVDNTARGISFACFGARLVE